MKTSRWTVSIVTALALIVTIPFTVLADIREDKRSEATKLEVGKTVKQAVGKGETVYCSLTGKELKAYDITVRSNVSETKAVMVDGEEYYTNAFINKILDEDFLDIKALSYDEENYYVGKANIVVQAGETVYLELWAQYSDVNFEITVSEAEAGTRAKNSWQKVEYGQTAEFEVLAYMPNSEEVHYKWRASDYDNSESEEEVGTDSPKLKVKVTGNRVYSCEIATDDNSYYEYFAAEVKGKEGIEPEIKTITSEPNSKVEIKAAVPDAIKGDIKEYVWQVTCEDWDNEKIFTTSVPELTTEVTDKTVFVICNAKAEHDVKYEIGQYDIDINNDLKVSFHDQRIEVNMGESVTLAFDVTAKDKSRMKYIWRDDDDEFFSKTTKEPKFEIDMVKEGHRYNCYVDDGYGNDTWVNFEVFVKNNLNVKSNQTKGDVEVLNGEDLTVDLSVTADDMKNIKYDWTVEIYGLRPDGTFGFFSTVDKKATGSSYTLKNITKDTYISYKVTDKFGNVIEGSHFIDVVDKKTDPSDNDQIAAFVARIYDYVLAREPEEGGAKFWRDQLYNFEQTGAAVAMNFIKSDEFIGRNTSNTEFVEILYKTFFGRSPEKEGFEFWTKALEDGTLDRDAVASGFIFSQEWADTCASYGIRSGGDIKPSVDIKPTDDTFSFVERMYTTAMKRESDEGGKNFWADELSNFRISGEAVGASFFLSDELTNMNLDNKEFVTRLYKTFMDRDPEQGGFDFWVKFLDDGNSRQDVVYGFTRSEEFVNLCIKARILPF